MLVGTPAPKEILSQNWGGMGRDGGKRLGISYLNWYARSVVGLLQIRDDLGVIAGENQPTRDQP